MAKKFAAVCNPNYYVALAMNTIRSHGRYAIIIIEFILEKVKLDHCIRNIMGLGTLSLHTLIENKIDVKNLCRPSFGHSDVTPR